MDDLRVNRDLSNLLLQVDFAIRGPSSKKS
jgi:hypothetical protein